MFSFNRFWLLVILFLAFYVLLLYLVLGCFALVLS